MGNLKPLFDRGSAAYLSFLVIAIPCLPLGAWLNNDIIDLPLPSPVPVLDLSALLQHTFVRLHF